MKFIRKLRVFWIEKKIWVIVGTFLTFLIIMSVVMLGMLDSYARIYMLASMPIQLLMGVVHAAVFIFGYTYFLRGGFSKLDKKSALKSKDIKVKFSDVIGLVEAKRESMEVVSLISDRARLKKIGGKIIRGILMLGPPGCGKTYLAKAIATEAKMPFLSISGSEFVEVFVGVGASRVRQLFKKARMLAYEHGACIIFIDELDVIGRGRTFSFMGGGSETNSTQNQLLVEMDGLDSRSENVIVIGATNAKEEVLDKALLRPGRFDRKIFVDMPNLEEREELFKYYLNSVKYSKDINVSRLAKKCVYKSPADIENIIKESALIATRENKPEVEYKDLSQAIERIELGVAHRKSMTKREKEMVAYHETGHLVVLYLLHPTHDVFKASIISRGGALGVVYHQPKEELYTRSSEEIVANIKVALSGYMAEKIKYGMTSDGVSSDFKAAMHQASDMVWRLGMGDIGYLGDYTSIPENMLSEDIKAKFNNEANRILSECAKNVEELLKKEWPIVERFVKELLEKEELDYDEIEEIFIEFGKNKHDIIQE